MSSVLSRSPVAGMDSSGAGPRAGASVQAAADVRAVEGEGGDLRLEALTGHRRHGVAAGHQPVGRVERAATRVAEGLARLQHRLLADDAGAAHLLAGTVPVDDAPMAGAQLHLFAAVIYDLDRIGEEIPALVRRGFLLDEAGLNRHADSPRLGLVHRPIRPFFGRFDSLKPKRTRFTRGW